MTTLHTLFLYEMIQTEGEKLPKSPIFTPSLLDYGGKTVDNSRETARQ